MKLKHLRVNYLIQIIYIIITICYYKTLNNMFMAFMLVPTGFLAGLLHKFLIYIYIFLQIIIYLLVYKHKNKKLKTIFALVIISTPLLGWISVFNAFAFIYLTKNKRN